MKALIIDEPWIGKILAGTKTWEMRKTACYAQERIALIRKGSGAVVGVADCRGSLPALETPEAYAAAEPMHGIPPARQVQAFADGWRTPWVLENARAIAKPFPYAHPSGAVIWVNLDPTVAASVEAQLDIRAPLVGGAAAEAQPVAAVSQPLRNQISRLPEPVSDGARVLITVSQGNLNNGHFYVPLDFFPPDAIGGNNKTAEAPLKVTFRFNPGQTVSTDIDGTKRIPRSRGPVKDFLLRSGAQPGDRLCLTRTSDYGYDVALAGRDA